MEGGGGGSSVAAGVPAAPFPPHPHRHAVSSGGHAGWRHLRGEGLHWHWVERCAGRRPGGGGRWGVRIVCRAPPSSEHRHANTLTHLRVTPLCPHPPLLFSQHDCLILWQGHLRGQGTRRGVGVGGFTRVSPTPPSACSRPPWPPAPTLILPPPTHPAAPPPHPPCRSWGITPPLTWPCPCVA